MVGFQRNRRGGRDASWLARTARNLAPVLVGLVASIAPARADGPAIVVSIKPIHSLVASVMEGVGEPILLVESGGSPHGYTLKPSQASAMADADLVIWIGEGMESYLSAPIESLVQNDRVLELADLSGVVVLPLREGGVWEPHIHGDTERADDDHADNDHADEEHADEHAGEDHAEDEHAQEEHADEHAEEDHAHEHGHAWYDPHLWLDPQNALVMARAIADRLVLLDPGHREAYEANLAALTDALEGLDGELATMLAPVRATPYIVFHDAYQYFERRYGLTGVGSITLDPEQGASAARLSAIRERLAAADVVCAFAEPLVDQGLLDTAIEGTDVRVATLDPEGVLLDAGPALYATLISGLAQTMATCLASPG